MKINKLSLPTTIIIVSIILGGFYYASQVSKQNSIERQQQAKLEQENKEYVAKRKMECYEIYEKERKRWDNVEGNYYIESRNVCEINYENGKYDKAVCKQKVEEKLKKGDDRKALILWELSDTTEERLKELLLERLKNKEITREEVKEIISAVRVASSITECDKYFTKEF